MSKNLYDATIMQLRGRALEAYATLDMLFSNPTAIPDHTEWSAEIVKHAEILAKNENAMITLQQYFGPRYAPAAPPPVAAAPPAPAASAVVTPETSPTLARSAKKAPKTGAKTKKSKKE